MRRGNAERAVRLAFLREMLREYFIIAAIFAMMAALMFKSFWWKTSEATLDNPSEIRQEIGQVAEYKQGGRRKFPGLVLRFDDGRRVTVYPDPLKAPFVVGQKVRVSYRTGSDGRIYVEQMEPVEEKRFGTP
jgi:hypothetical protein